MKNEEMKDKKGKEYWNSGVTLPTKVFDGWSVSFTSEFYLVSISF